MVTTLIDNDPCCIVIMYHRTNEIFCDNKLFSKNILKIVILIYNLSNINRVTIEFFVLILLTDENVR